ncbi:MAG TPA: class I SAM-dependent methyltransferase family protein [Thermodesulfobacteriota bacterium]|nr:class I SAM-dependent methyltransferase family protein [Thermodesulfobacteriota bacterium]
MHPSRMPSFDELLKPPPAYYPKNIYYKFYSLFLRTIGMFSEGMRIGFIYGFDSGMIMNYVYQNTPSGRFYIGKVLDRIFLNQVTCKAFRAIKEIQKNVIKNYLQERNGNPTFIVDLASGKADYIYDALRETNANVKVLLRDIDETALKESRVIAERFNLLKKVSYEQGNALDIKSLERIHPKPNLIVEVGLYGIIHDDELLRSHFFELKDILNPGAILFNVQTYNPQIELIARVLKNRDGERCVWHLRPVELVIGWAEKAGFNEPQVIMDPYGIYSVVMMRG